MDKIYSRKRIRIPILFRKKAKEQKEKRKSIPILIFFIILICFVIKSLDPIFENICAKEAMANAIEIITNEVNMVLKQYNYQDIVEIEENNNSKILKTNVVVINNISTDIINNISAALNKQEKMNINIPLGALTGNKFFIGAGPNIKVKVIPVGTIKYEIKTEFKEKGINQTVYRIFLETECEINILMPYKSINRKIVNQILLVESAIVGDVPETYYNLEKMQKEDTINLIN